MSQAQDRAAARPGRLPALHQRATSPPSRSAQAVPGYPEQDERSSGCSSGTRRSSASSACRWRPASTTRSTTTPATGSGSRPTSCLSCGWKPDEAAVLGLAARVWRRAELAGAAAGALLKLRAAGDRTRNPKRPTAATSTRRCRRARAPAGHAEPAFGPLWEAVRDRRPVTFSYRAAGRSEPQQRELEPWGVVNRHGRWYVAGRDRGRDAVRVFRLEPDRGPGGVLRAGRAGDRAGRHRRARAGPRLGLRARPGAHRPAQGAGRAPASGCAGTPSRCEPDESAPAMGPGRHAVRRPGLVRRLRRLVRPGRGGPDPPDLRDAVIRRLKGALA